MTSVGPEDMGRQAFDEAESMSKTARYRWAAVAYFYSALHLAHVGLQALPDADVAEENPDTHGGEYGTNNVLRRRASSIYMQYMALFNVSIDVRYHGGDVSKEQLDSLRFDRLPKVAEWACETAHDQPCDCWMRRL